MNSFEYIPCDREYLKVKVPPNGVSRVDGATGFLPVETGQKNRPNYSLGFFRVEPMATLRNVFSTPHQSGEIHANVNEFFRPVA